MGRKVGGFTPIELVVSIVVIAILATVGAAAYNGIRHRAYDAKIDATLEQIEKAFRLYTTKGNAVPIWHFSRAFYKKPGGGSLNHNIPIHAGGGIGTDMAKKGFIPGDIISSLNDGPDRYPEITLDKIWFITCGKNKFFLIAESYSGISLDEMNTVIYQKNSCHWINQSILLVYGK
ncbi:MAG: hypothetical protein Q4A34_02575 [Candidatus Saccharibacteria bacterium]|nr:hypothetical protein [Candidatus Saccharibacteria bacterium]